MPLLQTGLGHTPLVVTPQQLPTYTKCFAEPGSFHPYLPSETVSNPNSQRRHSAWGRPPHNHSLLHVMVARNRELDLAAWGPPKDWPL